MDRLWGLGWLALLGVVNAVAAEDVPDWVTREELPAALQQKVGALCDGVFLEPVFPGPIEDRGALRAAANTATYRLGEGGRLSGDVLIRHAARRLTADVASLDEASGDVVLEGEVEFRQPGLLLQGARGRYNLNRDEAWLEDARYVIHASGVHGRADVVAYDGKGILQVRRGRFTRCEPGAEAWALESRRIRIDQEKRRGTATGAVLRLGGVPVFFIPYIRFPVTDERQSGFLVPEVGYSQESGIDVAVPYYFNLAPNYDATVTPRIMSERGVLTEVEFRHLARFGRARVGGAYMPSDDQFNGRLSRDDFKLIDPNGDFDPAQRWLLVLEQEARAGRMRTRVDYGTASDDEYFRDLGSDLSISSRTELRHFGEIAYLGGALRRRVYGEGYQALEADVDDSYRRIPAFDFGYSKSVGELPLEVGIDAQITRFGRNQDNLVGLERVIGKRFHLVPKLGVSVRRRFGHLRVSLEELLTYYDLDDLPPGAKGSHDRT
ncbi:MAG: LPS assembly protein LptD, partial [Pseudomonadales bacterium]